MQISIYTLIQDFECAYYIILLYVYSNKRVFNCKTTISSYSMATLKHRVLRHKESEDEG